MKKRPPPYYEIWALSSPEPRFIRRAKTIEEGTLWIEEHGNDAAFINAATGCYIPLIVVEGPGGR